MPDSVIRSAFDGPGDEFNGSGKRPVVFDVFDSNMTTSLLPDGLKMVLHVNPASMRWTYTQHIERTQTEGGFVEAHWGAQPTELNVEMVTGGFVRLHGGLSNVTGPTPSSPKIYPTTMRPIDVGGTRRDTIAYDKYLDMLALFYFNGAIYDVYGNIAIQGVISLTYDGGTYWGYFSNFSVDENVERPYMFGLTFTFVVRKERHRIRGQRLPRPQSPSDNPRPQPSRDKDVSSVPNYAWENVPRPDPPSGPPPPFLPIPPQGDSGRRRRGR